MDMHATTLIEEVAAILNDAEEGYEHIRWTREDLVNYLYDAELALYAAKPEAYGHDEAFTLRPGTRQGPLPDGCTLQKVIGTTGSSKRTRKVNDGMLQAFAGLSCKPNCDDGGEYAVSGFSFTPEDPSAFFVDPPVPDDGETHKVDITCLQEPTPLTVANLDDESTDVIKTPSRLHNPLIEFMLYRAYSVDMESGQSHAKSATHYQNFKEMVGIAKTEKTRVAVSQAGSAPAGAKP